MVVCYCIYRPYLSLGTIHARGSTQFLHLALLTVLNLKMELESKAFFLGMFH